MKIQEFFDKETNSFTFVLQSEGEAVVIDPVLNYNHFTGVITSKASDIIIDYLIQNELRLLYILDTHIHADHLSGNCYIKNKAAQLGFGDDVKCAIGKNVSQVTKYWAKIFNFKDVELDAAADFDLLLDEGDKIPFGNSEITAIFTPGHTPCCLTYKIDDNLFVGDLMFMPDVGTARCDFPGGSADAAYDSVQKIYQFDDNYKIFPAHDYPPENVREVRSNCTILEQKQHNKMIKSDTSKEDFIVARNTRDSSLELPKLIYPSLQYNIFAGKYTIRTTEDHKFTKIPVTIVKN